MTTFPTSQSPLIITNTKIKDRVTFVKRTDCRGSPTVLEIELAPNGGNGLHIHTSYDETFTAISGSLGLMVAGQELRLEAGQTATAKRGTVHRFFNPTQENICFRVEIMPGHRGFEQSILIAYGLANDGLTDNDSVPKNPLHTAVLLTLGDMTFPGVMGLVVPVFRLLAGYARSTGIERELLHRYGD